MESHPLLTSLNPMLDDRLYYFTKHGMEFKITVTHRASTVERWIHDVKKEFLDAAPIKCVGLDCEFTDPREKNQRAAVLQLSVAWENLVFQICYADALPHSLKQFLQDKDIRFCGAAINNDLRMLKPYGISILNPVNLQDVLDNPTVNPTPSLYDLANAFLGTKLKKKEKIKNWKGIDKNSPKYDHIFGWGNVLTYKQVKYAALDARLGFELARKHFRARGYNTHVDRLNLNVE